MMTLTITKIGNSEGIILPKEILAKLRVSKGDKIHLTETSEGFSLRNYDADFAEAMTLAEQIMHEDRDVLRKLAE